MGLTFPITFPGLFGDAEPRVPNIIRRGLSGQQTVVPDDQIVSIHTRKGVQLFQFTPNQYQSLSWTRNLRSVSRCGLVSPPNQIDLDRFPEILPWMHWVSVFDGVDNTVLWTGPIQKTRINRQGLSVECRDAGAYMSRTRNPMTKRWDAADPAVIAAELWESMADQKGLGQHPHIRPDPEGERFDFRSTADATTLEQTFGELVNLGLRWSIVNGVPVFGPMPLDPITTFGEHDFEGDSGIELIIDGSQTYNDVLVRGTANYGRASTELYGERLESIVKIDSVSDVSNVQRAAHEYIRHTSTFRRALTTPNGVTLHPEAPVTIGELIPSARMVITAYDLRQLVELESITVSRTAGKSTVNLTMEAVNELPELLDPSLGDQAQSGMAVQ
jgi:hypothetical protein